MTQRITAHVKVALLSGVKRHEHRTYRQALDSQTQVRVGDADFSGQLTVAEASRQYDLLQRDVEQWLEEAKAGMENALRAKPRSVEQQYEAQLRDLREAYGEAMLEIKFRKKLQRHLESNPNSSNKSSTR